MANDNNNKFNDLVADDDPTAELETPTFVQHQDAESELDAQTYDRHSPLDDNTSRGVTMTELQSELRARQQTIDKLQLETEQLQAKWRGLGAETDAREEQTKQLNDELVAAQEAITRKERLIKKRDRNIKLLKSEIRERHEEQRLLQDELAAVQVTVAESREAEAKSASGMVKLTDRSDEPKLSARLGRTEAYADTLRQKTQDLLSKNAALERDVERQSQQLSDALEREQQLTSSLAAAESENEDLKARLATIHEEHQQEIRTLRFELGEAQDTAVETSEINSQLASDLVDTRGFKEELERMLGDAEERSNSQIDGLTREVAKLNRKAQSQEQKLSTKSEAISLLLAELAKKSEQLKSLTESSGIIRELDQDFDEVENIEEISLGGTQERISRVLIGTVDDQVLRFPLFKERLTIGRTEDNDIQLKAAYVSRRHAVIQTEDETTRITDWGSKNGLHVNSKKTSEHNLKHGDIITIGNARFRFEEMKKRDS